ncbi:MAG: BamA/TamA family outer membrane protein [Vicinamibacterales bacterium]
MTSRLAATTCLIACVLGAGTTVAFAGTLEQGGPSASSPSGTSLGSVAAETITRVQVHGNTLTPESDVLAIAGIVVGTPFGSTTIAEVRTRLLASGRFDDVDVLKRFESIADPSRILLVLVVNERPGRIVRGAAPGEPARVIVRRGIRNLMFLPILEAEDGYGVTYGAQFAFVRLGGERGRVSVPLSWGGNKRAGAIYERSFASRALTRIQAGGEVVRRKNPAYEQNDDRQRIWGRAERRSGPVTVGVTAASERIGFAGVRERMASVIGDVTFDTRIDPMLARNAVYLHGAVERVGLSSGASTRRTTLDARGYLGLVRQTVLVARVLHQGARDALPPYLKTLLGGWSNLRGFRAGAFAGDNLAAGSLELRIPLSAALSIARLGVTVFTDAGVSYDEGERFSDAPVHRSVGAGAWLSVAAFRLAVSVAHGQHAETRVNFSAGLGF